MKTDEISECKREIIAIQKITINPQDQILRVLPPYDFPLTKINPDLGEAVNVFVSFDKFRLSFLLEPFKVRLKREWRFS